MIDVPRVAASVQSMQRSMTLYVAERVRPASPANGDPLREDDGPATTINRRDAKVASEVRRNVTPPVAMCTAAMNEKKPALALGGRSVMGLGPALGYREVPLSELNPKLNAETAVIVMLETAEGIENCEAIAAVDGLDVLLIGSGDLTTDLGIPGQVDHPRLRAAYERVAAACRMHNKVLGVGGIRHNTGLHGELIRLGARFVGKSG